MAEEQKRHEDELRKREEAISAREQEIFFREVGFMIQEQGTCIYIHVPLEIRVRICILYYNAKVALAMFSGSHSLFQ